jgi:BASS family bile acid:Na+ symporter
LRWALIITSLLEIENRNYQMKVLLLKIILNRNFILVLTLILALLFGEAAHWFKDYTFYILAIVMTFSTTGLSTKAMFPLKEMIVPILMGSFLNYIVFGLVSIGLSYWLMPTPELFLGFVVIASTPPGLAVIPFSHILGGDIKYAIVGLLGAFISSLFFSPLIIELFADLEGGINSMQLFVMMIKLVLFPLLISRLLLWKPILPVVVRLRGQIVDWGFALLIFTAVGLNRHVFFSNFDVLFWVSLVLFLSIFGLGWFYKLICRKLAIPVPVAITQNLLVTMKSSGFAVVTALSLFGAEAAIPSAVMAVFVLLYLLYLSIHKAYFKAE